MDEYLIKTLQKELKCKGNKVLEPYLKKYSEVLTSTSDPLLVMKGYEVIRYLRYYSEEDTFYRIKNIMKFLKSDLYKFNPNFELTSRLKSLHSASAKWDRVESVLRNKKSHHKNEFLNINDYCAYRFILFENDDNNLLEFVHELKRSFSKHFPAYEICKTKDYISNPKENGYKSYHLTLKDPITEITFEIQVRTLAQHFSNEYGEASWKNYKSQKYETTYTISTEEILKFQVPRFLAQEIITSPENEKILRIIDYAGIFEPIKLI